MVRVITPRVNAPCLCNTCYDKLAASTCSFRPIPAVTNMHIGPPLKHQANLFFQLSSAALRANLRISHLPIRVSFRSLICISLLRLIQLMPAPSCMATINSTPLTPFSYDHTLNSIIPAHQHRSLL